MSTAREAIEWIQIRWMEEEKTADHPRILLIGDSIVCGHATELHYELSECYAVDHFATSKIVCDAEYWSDLEFMLRKKKYAMILFNNGLHGVKEITDAEYEAGLKDVTGKLKPYTPRLVWRSSTPCYTLDPASPNPWVEHVPVRNAIAAKIMESAGVPMLDVYTPLAEHPEWSRDGIHFTQEGYQKLIETEKEYILRVLEVKK